MAITLDDLPGVGAQDLRQLQQMNRRVLAALSAARVPAVGFVNERSLHVDGQRDARVAILDGWLAAGMTLGNHTFGHQDLNRMPLSEFQDEIIKGEVVTRSLLEARQQRLRWFRHPFTHEGATREVKDGLNRFLADRGYAVAPFTIEHSDWVFASYYSMALRRGNRSEAQAIKRSYLEHFERMCGFFEGLSRDLLGREVPQILLTHVNPLNADALPELLGQLSRRGYRFVSLEQALTDPAYAAPDRWVGKTGPSWLHRWIEARGLPSRQREEPELPPEIEARQRARAERRPPAGGATSPAAPPAP